MGQFRFNRLIDNKIALTTNLNHTPVEVLFEQVSFENVMQSLSSSIGGITGHNELTVHDTSLTVCAQRVRDKLILCWDMRH